MFVQKLSVTVETDENGDVTAYTNVFTGAISQLRYVKDDFADNSTFLITVEGTGETVWSESNVNASATRAPRQALHSTLGAAVTYDGTRPIYGNILVAADRLKIVISSGGNAKGGTFHVLVG